MKIEIVERAPVRVAYLRYTGPFGAPLDRFWRTTVLPWLADHDVVDCPRYGVSIDDPTNTPPGLCRYHACVERGALSSSATRVARATITARGRSAASCAFRW